VAQAQLYEFSDYRIYLQKVFPGTGEGRGQRVRLAEYLNCQTSFLSQVLTDRTHLSLEHAIKTSEFLKHTPQEKKYFMLLVQKGKAGSPPLEKFFDQQIAEIKKKRSEIHERVGVKTELSAEDQMKYYSTWYYLAIHILTALPGLQSAEAIAAHLKLEMGTVKEALEFLESRGFIRASSEGYAIGMTRLHLPKGSSMLPRHHANWRIKAIESVDQEKPQDLHYSVLLGISKKDQKLLKEKLLKVIEEFEPVIQESKEEVPVVFLMDWFGI
jgi:uncharacterized protein (TIGR02147 family)